jgi:HEAT repeat protein
MHNEKPIQQAGRRKARERRLGADAVCILCLHPQLEALTLVRRSLLEAHHVLGEVNAPDVLVPLCRNCHAKVTEQLLQVGASMTESPTLLDRIASMIRALAAFLHELAKLLFDGAQRVVRFQNALDCNCPGWRTMPEAA